MILKIERYISNEDYLLLDNFVEISKTKGWKLSDPLCVNDFFINDCNDCTEFCLLTCVNKDGVKVNIAFDTTAYIMNDNGKTIEKIVVNYR